jgi:hypothetical protein
MHISIMDDEGDLLVRDAVVVAFFSKRPYPKLAKAFGEVFEWWLGATPDDAKRWACVDTEERWIGKP